MQGVPQITIRDILRHSSVDVTEKYMHAVDGMRKKAMKEAFAGDAFPSSR